MKTVIINKLKIVLYDSIEELPIVRFHKFNKYMLVDAGIGSDLNDINTRIASILARIDSDKNSAKIELENLRQSLFLVSEGTNVKHLSFVLLIESINGEKIFDLSDENVKRVSKRINTEKRSVIDRIIDSIKKKLDTELVVHFPDLFNDSESKEFYNKLRACTLLKLKALHSEKNNLDEVERLENEMLKSRRPVIFSGAKGAEIMQDKQFNEMCIFLSKEFPIQVQTATVQEFYSAFEYINKVRKSQNKKHK